METRVAWVTLEAVNKASCLNTNTGFSHKFTLLSLSRFLMTLFFQKMRTERKMYAVKYEYTDFLCLLAPSGKNILSHYLMFYFKEKMKNIVVISYNNKFKWRGYVFHVLPK